LTPADYEDAAALWYTTEGLVLRDADRPEAIASYLERNPGSSFVAVDGERLVGTVLCGHDGRQGYGSDELLAPGERRSRSASSRRLPRIVIRRSAPGWLATRALTMIEDLSRTAAMLERDVTRTLGPGHQHVIAAARANVEDLDIDDSDTKLVEDVQQIFHDTFVDTTWPACPRHHTHPLWYADGAWWCAKDRVVVAPLGELPTSSRPSSQ